MLRCHCLKIDGFCIFSISVGTPFFSDIKDEKKNSIFFSYNLPVGTLSSVLKILFFAKIVC
jgi:hypothetical protein